MGADLLTKLKYCEREFAFVMLTIISKGQDQIVYLPVITEQIYLPIIDL